MGYFEKYRRTTFRFTFVFGSAEFTVNLWVQITWSVYLQGEKRDHVWIIIVISFLHAYYALLIRSSI
jgi:hypothetical protein